jgi:hypothetical protein
LRDLDNALKRHFHGDFTDGIHSFGDLLFGLGKKFALANRFARSAFF